jgi:transposase/SAM-dependent methyltransferase
MTTRVIGLTPEILHTLYVEEGLSETEIAKRFNTHQVMINRRRKAWGIQTILRSDRLDLPEALTDRQVSILLGSMLGDGGIRKTGSRTASYSEHHSVAQREWLDWKVREWGPFYNATRPSDKGEHKGFDFSTHGCPHLYPYWKSFYPSGKGNKTFVNLDVDQIDDLALMVWYLDDGSTSGTYVRFSVGPDPKDHEVQLRVLRKFNLCPRLYPESNGFSIHLTNRTSLTRFIDRVGPQIPSAMAYKLDLKPRKMGQMSQDVLTEDRIRDLFARGFSNEGIAKVFNVSRQSVARAARRFGMPPRAPGRPKRASRPTYAPLDADTKLRSLDLSAPTFFEEALSILSLVPFEALLTAESIERDQALLRVAKTRVENATLAGMTKAGSVTCLQAFPHRFDARYREMPSVRVAWHDPHHLARAIQFQIRVGDPVTTKRVFRALQATLRAPTNFRPCFAKALVEAYCPPGGSVLDPCAGYGGRACGTLAAGRLYTGVDPHPQAPEAYARLARLMGQELTFHNQPFEDVNLGAQTFDMVFTSPPYFSVERYDDGPTQSWVRYKTWLSWSAGFLAPLVRKSWDHLKPGGVAVINTKNVRMGQTVVPIADELRRLAIEAGFVEEPSITLPLGRLGKRLTTEPVFVFRKSSV